MFPLVLRRASMNVRWVAWTIGIAAISLVMLFPLRLALGWSDLERIGFTARQVGGTIWYGRIGEMHLRSQPLGTLEVTLEPTALLLGKINMAFSRLDSPEGPLTGRIVAGASRGIRGVSGRIAVGEMFAPLPIAALELSDVTAIFVDGKCREAGGQVRPVLAAPVPGLSLDAGLTAPMECEGERARVRLESPSGAEIIEFYFQESGDYRGWISIRSSDPMVNSSLGTFGFRPSAEGMRLTMDGRL